MTTFDVDNATVLSGLSPYNWYKNGVTYLRAVNCGARLSLGFTGTSFALDVDVSGYVGGGIASEKYPTLSYSVDGGAISTRQLLSSDTTVTLASGLADTSHTIVVSVDDIPGTGGAESRWTGLLSVTLTGVVVGDGKTISTPSFATGGYALVYGDSITENIGVPASRGWAFQVCEDLNLICGNCAFAGQGWNASPAGIPAFPDAYDLILSGVNRTFTPTPKYVFINQGHNGTAVEATMLSTLADIRTSVGSLAYIVLMVPFAQVQAANVTAGFNAYVTANPSDRITLIDLSAAGEAIIDNVSLTPDGTHPNEAGCTALAELIAPLVPTIPLNSGSPSTAFSSCLAASF
jgi:hypothetical protein